MFGRTPANRADSRSVRDEYQITRIVLRVRFAEEGSMDHLLQVVHVIAVILFMGNRDCSRR
jgi:hypothetical protein